MSWEGGKLDTLKGVRRILIVLMGSIGDVARGILVATAIKKSHPEIEIAWLVEPKSKDVVLNTPSIDKVIVFERGAGLGALWNSIKEIRDFKAEVTLDMQRHLKSGVFSWLSGAPKRIGFAKRNTKEFNWVFQTDFTEYVDDSESKIKAYLGFLTKLGIPVQNIEFGLKPEPPSEYLESLLPTNGKLIGLVLGSAWETKNWPVEGYKSLVIEILKKQDVNLVLLGDKSQIGSAEEIEKLSQKERLLNLVGKTKLREIISLMPRMDLLVGPDSGPGHIAAAVGVKQVTIFGPTPPERVAPFGSEKLVVKAEIPCAPCMRRVCPGLNKICMRLVSPQLVLGQICKALSL